MEGCMLMCILNAKIKKREFIINHIGVRPFFPVCNKNKKMIVMKNKRAYQQERIYNIAVVLLIPLLMIFFLWITG